MHARSTARNDKAQQHLVQHSTAQHSKAQRVFACPCTLHLAHKDKYSGYTAQHGSAWVHFKVQADLGPAGALLVHVPDFVRSLANGQVLLHIPAVPPILLQLHAQGIVLSHGVHGRAPHLHDGLSPHQEVGTCCTQQSLVQVCH